MFVFSGNMHAKIRQSDEIRRLCLCNMSNFSV